MSPLLPPLYDTHTKKGLITTVNKTLAPPTTASEAHSSERSLYSPYKPLPNKPVLAK